MGDVPRAGESYLSFGEFEGCEVCDLLLGERWTEPEVSQPTPGFYHRASTGERQGPGHPLVVRMGKRI